LLQCPVALTLQLLQREPLKKAMMSSVFTLHSHQTLRNIAVVHVVAAQSKILTMRAELRM
jgi:hypothetical protein